MFTEVLPAKKCARKSLQNKELRNRSCNASLRGPRCVAFPPGMRFDRSCPDDFPGQNGGDLGPAEAVKRSDSGTQLTEKGNCLVRGSETDRKGYRKLERVEGKPGTLTGYPQGRKGRDLKGMKQTPARVSGKSWREQTRTRKGKLTGSWRRAVFQESLESEVGDRFARAAARTPNELRKADGNRPWKRGRENHQGGRRGNHPGIFLPAQAHWLQSLM